MRQLEQAEFAFKVSHTIKKSRKSKFGPTETQELLKKQVWITFFLFFLIMLMPMSPMKLRKTFHRLTHICSIRSQWNFCNDTFSYVRMIHFKPWKPIFQCKFKKHVFELFFNWKNEKTCFWTIFNFNLKKSFLELFFQK